MFKGSRYLFQPITLSIHVSLRGCNFIVSIPILWGYVGISVKLQVVVQRFENKLLAQQYLAIQVRQKPIASNSWGICMGKNEKTFYII